MSVTIYGIANCTTVRKARAWLEHKGIDHVFHDVRQDGLDEAVLSRWADRSDWRSLLNQRSSTFRAIADKEAVVTNRETALAAMLRQPTLIKRPVLNRGDTVLVGFNETEWENALC